VREDDVRKDLLFAGTELGVFVSFNGGKEWSSFQLNLPITPITDLRIHQNDLIAATSGRSFWILDDLTLIRQYKPASEFHLFQPEDVILANGGSQMDGQSDGTNPYVGVNPATGVVLYYSLPELKANEHIQLDIKDANGNLVRTFSSLRDSLFQEHAGGPPAEPVLTKEKGINRFVWNLRYPTISGITGTYMEASFRGHKASPGKYSAVLISGAQKLSVNFQILPNPLYAADSKTYQEYHTTMLGMETEISRMHKLVTSLHEKQLQLDKIIESLPAESKFENLKQEGNTLSTRMKQWDEDMIQRKSKAYDDVENFPNKFTADYLFLINQTESDIPQVNKPSLDLLAEYTAKWKLLEARANEFLQKDIPALNKKLWDAGIGAVWIK